MDSAGNENFSHTEAKLREKIAWLELENSGLRGDKQKLVLMVEHEQSRISVLDKIAENYRAMLLKLCDAADHVRHSRYPERAGINEMAVVVIEARKALSEQHGGEGGEK